ncbi:hypothetical protein HB912_11630 [Listeria aquatica]|uniref:Uncharacterized protein n=1 Tax=Listeria aquatica TaxID=1494960 RepID=A0A841ZRX8_9LIST|nr:hypothetical protein [Listeria aquatica]MBC1522297.1 hypothetical protein [Listeria aquatica]
MNYPMFVGKRLTLEEETTFAQRETNPKKIQQRLSWKTYYRQYIAEKEESLVINYPELKKQVFRHIRQTHIREESSVKHDF